jgi:hypothetical protein
MRLEAGAPVRTFWAPDAMLNGYQDNCPTVSLAQQYPRLADAASSLVAVIMLPAFDTADEWHAARMATRATLQSLQRQRDPRWRAIVAGDGHPGLAEMDDPRVSWLRAPDPIHERSDVDRRGFAVASAALAAGTAYVVAVEPGAVFDPSLVGSVLDDDNGVGYAGAPDVVHVDGTATTEVSADESWSDVARRWRDIAGDLPPLP